MTWTHQDDFVAALDANFPSWNTMGDLVSVENGMAISRLEPTALHLRPGGTVSGPAMFAMADVCMYLAILWTLGAGAGAAVTADMHSRFLRRPPGDGPLVCKARLIRIGRNLIITEAVTHAEGDDEPLALFTASYSNPTGTKFELSSPAQPDAG